MSPTQSPKSTSSHHHNVVSSGSKRLADPANSPVVSKRARMDPNGAVARRRFDVPDPGAMYDQGLLSGVDVSDMPSSDVEQDPRYPSEEPDESASHEAMRSSNDPAGVSHSTMDAADDADENADDADDDADLEAYLEAADKETMPPMKAHEVMERLLRAAKNIDRPKGGLPAELPAIDNSAVAQLQNAIYEAARHASSETFQFLLRRDRVGALHYYHAQMAATTYACELLRRHEAKIDFLEGQMLELQLVQEKHEAQLAEKDKQRRKLVRDVQRAIEPFTSA